MAKLNIHVGATVDRSLTVAFQPLIEAARKAQKAIDTESKKSARAISTETRKGVNDAEAKFKELERQIATGLPKSVGAGTTAIKSFARETSMHFSAVRKSFSDVARDAESAMARIEKTQRGGGVVSRGGYGRPVAKKSPNGIGLEYQNVPTAKLSVAKAFGMTKAALGSVAGVAMDVARGAGVQDFSTLMQKNVSLEDAAVQLSNSGFMPGKAGAAGKRQDPRKLIEEMRNVAIGTGTESADISGGMQAFVGKTGDLETGRAVMEKLSKLSKATGSNTTDMFDAAGDVSNALGDVEGKGDLVYEVMKNISAMGKEGAVEIKDLATQMAKLGAASGAYRGNHASVMGDMSALVQMARARGGAASATQAATSVGSFTNTFDKGAREKAFKEFGVKTRDSSGKLNDAKQIIIDTIRAASSDSHGGMSKFSENMGQMFADAGARRSTKGFETIFKDAGGGEAGIRAVSDAFDNLKNSVMSEQEVTDSFNASMNTQSAQAKKFNEEWAKAINEIQVNMLPALKDMAPIVIDITKKLGEVAGFITGSTKQRSDDEARASDVEAHSMSAGLTRKLKEGGAFTDEDLAKGKATLARLNAGISQKRANMTEEPGEASKLLGQDYYDAKKSAAATDREGEASMQHERSQLERLVAIMEKQHATQQKQQAELQKQREIMEAGGTKGAPSVPSKGRQTDGKN